MTDLNVNLVLVSGPPCGPESKQTILQTKQLMLRKAKQSVQKQPLKKPNTKDQT